MVVILLALLWQARLVGYVRASKYVAALAVGFAVSTVLYTELERLGLSWLVSVVFIPLIVVGIVLILRDVADWLSGRL